MILTVDIGNTNITIGVFRGEKLISKSSLATQQYRKFKSFWEDSVKKRHCALSDLECAVICSVVPQLTPIIKKVIASKGGIPVYILGKDIKVPIKNLYAKPKQVGQDRLVCAYMAARLYGAPAISLDLGTAITFDVVSKNSAYLGGIILPGLELSLRALYEQTALLPQVNLATAKSLIGRDTQDSMLSGITFGFGSMIDGLIEKLRKELRLRPKVIATGGDSVLIKPYCREISYFEPDLILKGIADLAKNF